MGDAVNSILEQERGSPLAGIVVISDGRNNAGIDPLMMISEATLQAVPIHTVGMGSARNPLNVRTVDIEAPKRVFPGDRFRLTALLQASGLEGKQITVQLRRRSGAQKNAGMAIEDAACLGMLLNQGASDLPVLLQRYAALRWQRNARVQARALRNGEIFHLDGLTRWGRDTALKVIGERLLDLPWLYGAA